MRDLYLVATNYKLANSLGRVAQSVEQRIENPRVTGSIPVPATSILKAHSNVGFFISSTL